MTRVNVKVPLTKAAADTFFIRVGGRVVHLPVGTFFYKLNYFNYFTDFAEF